MIQANWTRLAGVSMTCCAISIGGAAQAVTFDAIQIFGDSFSDTGANVTYTNGGTAASYLAEAFGNPVVLPGASSPGTQSINFAESGAKVVQQNRNSPTSVSNQVIAYTDLVNSGAASFDTSSTLFFLAGGLNDHKAPAGPIADAVRKQVSDLVTLGASYIQLALLPTAIPEFKDSADNLNPVYRSLVTELSETYGDISITLNNWGSYYDDIILDPATYGFSNVTDSCTQRPETKNKTFCDNPDEYFYYFTKHPSDAAHRVVADRLFADLQALKPVGSETVPQPGLNPVPLPASAILLFAGLAGIGALRARRS
ncbi:SGNH/GDSL hydrolase family protein [uncultured Jannaschia sp.]|uniref:SGNH/GDSL hydrolase family protein n=1 Tax=uncultured Jannaschia sp. TaxID=293347 RepID=UPI0026236D6A|nr:SGNH/GDSL hydrolase family protein [uncultured Jannaschia sp.]